METGAAAERASVRTVSRNGGAHPADHDGATTDLCRVRDAVRIPSKNGDELAHGADFNACVEPHPEETVNTTRLKEEVDYESLDKKVENVVDHLTLEMERQQKLKQDEKIQLEERPKESKTFLNGLGMTSRMQFEKEEHQFEYAVIRLTHELEEKERQNKVMSERIFHLETSLNQKKQQELEIFSSSEILAKTSEGHEKKMIEMMRQLEAERFHSSYMKSHFNMLHQQLNDAQNSVQFQENTTHELKRELSKITEEFTSQVHSLEEKISQLISEKGMIYEELKSTQEKVQHETRHRKSLEAEALRLQRYSTDNCAEESETLGSETFMSKARKLKETLSSQRGAISKIFGEDIMSLLKSKNLEEQIRAVKVVANLSAEDINQEKIIEEGGLDALLSLLETSENTIILRVTAGAIANLAMNVSNQRLIMGKGGARLLANVATKTDDPQTMRMVSGAIANLCGTEKLHVMLKQDGGIKALLGMFESGHNDVIAQIARGLANFAKCESRAISQGQRKGQSLLIEDGVLAWIMANSTRFTPSARSHIELVFCHLALNEDNSRDIIVTGGIKELLRISRESSRDDTRNLAKKVLNSNSAFLKEIQ